MDPLLTRIDTEIAAGRPWRAKEIVRGTISNAWPEPDVLERYGRLLLDLGDELEAGKYLWLSGMRSPAYEKAVALFLARQGRHGRGVLLAQLPKSFRRLPFDQLPIELRGQLRARGIGAGDFGVKRGRVPLRGSRWKDWTAAALGLGLLACLIVGVGVGFRTVVLWVAQVFR